MVFSLQNLNIRV